MLRLATLALLLVAPLGFADDAASLAHVEPIPSSSSVSDGGVRVAFARWHDPFLRRGWAEFVVANATLDEVYVRGDRSRRPIVSRRFGERLESPPDTHARELLLPAGQQVRFDAYVTPAVSGDVAVGVTVALHRGTRALPVWSPPVQCRPVHEPLSPEERAERVELRVVDVDPRHGADARIVLALVNPTPFDLTYSGASRTAPALVWNAADASSHRLLSQWCGNSRRDFVLPAGRALVFDADDLPEPRDHPFRVTVLGVGRPTSTPITLPPLTFDVEPGALRLTTRGERPGYPFPLIVLENGTGAPVRYEGRSAVAPTHRVVAGTGAQTTERTANDLLPEWFTLPAGKGIAFLELHLGGAFGRPERLEVDVTLDTGEVARLVAEVAR